MTSRIVDLLRNGRAWIDQRLTGRTKRVLMIVAVLAFLVGGLLSLRALDIDTARISWVPLIVAGVVGVPLTAVVNAGEYAVTARIVGRRVGLVPALRISVLSTAANMLPIPGAALVRIRALRELGRTYRSATSATVIVGLTWIGVSAALAGAWMVAIGATARGALFLGPGIALLVAAWTVLRGTVESPARRRRLAAAAIGIELISVVTSALRIVLVLAGLGLEPSIVGGLVLAVSGSAAAAAGVFPAGLGLREIIAAALAPVAGLPAAAGFVASAVNRILGIVMHAPIAGGLAFTDPDTRAAAVDDVLQRDPEDGGRGDDDHAASASRP